MAAKRLSKHNPKNIQWAISLAYATRRVESIEAAKSVLSEAVKSHPEEHLVRATKAGVKFRTMALDDTDLEPLWSEIARLDA